jgi:hypothetical protein
MMDRYQEAWRGGRKVIAVVAVIGVLYYGFSGRFRMAVVVVAVAAIAIVGNWLTARYATKQRRQRDSLR